MENYVSINSDRLWARLNEVGHIGSDPRGGISRFAWEPPYKEAVMLLYPPDQEHYGFLIRKP